MKTALVVFTDGRRDCLIRTLDYMVRPIAQLQQKYLAAWHVKGPM